MGYSTGIQYGTAVINKVNKPLTTNLNENTWKLAKPNVISSFSTERSGTLTTAGVQHG